MKNSSINSLESINKLSQSKQLTNKQLDFILSTLQKYLTNSNNNQFELLYQCFINLFISIQSNLSNKTQSVFKIFYQIIKVGDDKNQKIFALIHNILDIAQKRKDQIESNKCLKNLLGLVRKAAEKQWGPDIVNIFIRYYLQRLQDYCKGKYLNINTIKQLSQIITLKYKHQTTIILNKLINNLSQSKIIYLYLYFLLEIQHLSQFILTIIKSIQQLTCKEINNNIKLIFYKQFIYSFIKFIQDGLFQQLDYLCLLCPICLKNQVYQQIILSIFIGQQPIKKQQTGNIDGYLKYISGKILNKKQIEISLLVYYYINNSHQLIQIIKNQIETQNRKLLQDSLEMIGYQEPFLTVVRNQQIIKILAYINSEIDQQPPLFENLSVQQLNEIISDMLQISKKQQKPDYTIKANKQFPQLSYQLFQILNIYPKKQIPIPIKPTLKIQSVKIKRCLLILQQLIKMYQIQQIVSIVKKYLIINYDKINQYTIRQNIHNGFLIKILYLTGTKIKIISDIILRTYNDEDLLWIFPKISKNIIKQYCQYLASKDKYRFKIEIYQKGEIQHQWIIYENVNKMIF